MSWRNSCALVFLLCFQAAGQNTFPLNQMDALWTSVPPLVNTPLTFGTLSTTNGVTLVDTPEGSANFSLNGTERLLTVDTQGDTYTSTMQNVTFTPGLSTNTLSGEKLQFSSSTNSTRTDIDRFSFSGGQTDFRFELEDFHTTGSTNWGGESLTYRNSDGMNDINATQLYIRREDGRYIQIGEVNFSEENKRLEMTSILGQHDGYTFSADQLNLMQRGDTDIGNATNLYIGRGPNEFVQVGTADLHVSPNRTSLSLTSLTGSKDGYDFSSDTFNYTEADGNETLRATGVFIKNQNGEYIQIGEANYSEANKRLEMTSILGQHDGFTFSADQLNLMQRGDTDIGNGTNLYIGLGPNEFFQVGTADFALDPQGSRLSLTSLTGGANGYELSADQLNANLIGETARLEIVNGRAVKEEERLSFGNAVINSDGDRISADVKDLSFSNADLSYTSDRLIGSTNGEALDLNTAGVLNISGNNLDVNFLGRGVNSLTTSGPAEGGGILLERNGDGTLTRAVGSVSLGTTEDGGISDIGVALGENISFRATDADGNARELTASFSFDQETGKFYLKTVFKGGDQTEIKIYPFSFTSEQVGEDAVAALSASLETQNIEAYLNTMSRIIDLERINDFIAIGEDRMQVRVGRKRGLEFYYANDSLNILDGETNFPNSNGEGKNLALGIGFFNLGPDNSVSSGGVLLSSDSSLRYHVESGTMSFNGLDLPDRGEIPLTIGAYYRHEDQDGNAVFGTLGTSLAELGTVSAGVTFERQITNHSSYTMGLAGNTNGDIAANIGLQITFPKVNNSSRRLGEKSYYDPREVGDMASSIRELRATSR
jgi:uncharacterized protein YrzB (UPF0473 family)